MLHSFQFSSPIYNPSAVVERMQELSNRRIIKIISLSSTVVQVELLSSEHEVAFLEIANSCLQEACEAYDF